VSRLLPSALAAPLAALLVLALPAAGLADEDDADEAPRIARSRSVGEPGARRPTVLHPVQGMHAQAFPTERWGVWAQSHGFSLTRRSAVYDIEGGAALRLDEGVHLIASYRMLGVDLGFDSDVEGADGEPGIAAPFIGMSFDV
jgi:hypothetical protein